MTTLITAAKETTWWGECRQVERFGHRAKISALDSRLQKRIYQTRFQETTFSLSENTVCDLHIHHSDKSNNTNKSNVPTP